MKPRVFGSSGTSGASLGSSTFPGSVCEPCQEKLTEPEWNGVLQAQRCEVGWDTQPQPRDSLESWEPATAAAPCHPCARAMGIEVFIYNIYSGCQHLLLKDLGAEHICPRQKGCQEPCQPRLPAPQPRQPSRLRSACLLHG